MRHDERRKWAVEQAIKLLTALPLSEAPSKVEDLANRLVEYVNGDS